MKTKIKRHSRAVMSVILAVSMLISCMTVGLIATDAAKVTGDEELGATEFYLYYRTDNTKSLDGMTAVKMAKDGNDYTASFDMVTGTNFDLGIGTSSTPSNTWVTSSWTVTKDTGINFANIEDNSGVYFVVGSVKTAGKVNVKFTPNTTLDLSTSAGGSTGDSEYVVTGDSAITGTSGWSNNSDDNKLDYDENTKRYSKTYTVSSTAAFNFRIVPSGTWEKTWGFDRANLVDAAGIVTTWKAQPNSSDNNIQMQLSQPANIEIVFDDSVSDESAITVTVTPTISTVTAAVTPAGSGTATVRGSSSATVDYGDTVSLNATPGADYLFSNWMSGTSNISISSSTKAATTATVRGTGTVTANFIKKSFTVSKGIGEGFTITSPASAQTKQWGTEVTVSAKTSSDVYYIKYLYYKVNDEGEEVKFSDDTTNTPDTLTESFTMPKNNVTVYAKVDYKPSYTINYDTCTNQSAYGYVTAGVRDTSDTTISQTIEKGSKVLAGTRVNYGARPATGYKFVGWFSDAAGNNLVSSLQDYSPAAPTSDVTLYAKFESLAASSGIRIYIPSANAEEKIWVWDFNSEDTNPNGNKSYDDRLKASAAGTAVTLNGSTYYMFDFPNTVSGLHFRMGDNQGNHEYSSAGTYVMTSNTSVTSGSPTFTVQYPVKLNVTNSDLGSASLTYFAAGGTNTTVTHTPTDTSNNKTQYVDNSGAAVKTTSATHNLAMPANGTSASTTITFIPKEYYKVNFSAGSGGTIKASTGSTYAAANDIKSGTSVKEGTAISFVAEPASGYEVVGWTGDVTDSTSTTRTITAENFNSEKTVRVFFKKNRGTSNTGTKFGYGTDNNPSTWTITNTYVENGRVYAYIDNPTATTTYYFQAYQYKASYSTEEKYTYQYYRNNENSWADTNFNPSVYDIYKYKRDSDYNASCNEIQFKVTSDVIGVKIDLGPVKSGTTGEADPYNDGNTYHIIPIYNKAVGKVTVYAKDGSYRGNADYDYFPGIADTDISSTTGVTNIVEHTAFDTAVATKGQSITVTTTIDSGHKGRYFVRGYSVNGVTPELYEYNAEGVYSMTYTIPTNFEDDYLEITPIYAEHGVTNVRFYIENYDEAFQNTGWGNTLSVYPYYQDPNTGKYVSDKHNAFGGYPGQPVINNGGRRFIEIPVTYKTLTSDGAQEDCEIKGVTLSNDYFDIVHRDYCREVDNHLQTYDYDDFYKIYKETSDHKEVNQADPTDAENPRYNVADQITFALKHRTETNNFADSSNTVTYSTTGNTVHAPYTSFTTEEKTSKFGNGWEPLLDYHDRPVDLFGKQLTTAEQAKEPLLVVSDDYSISYVGRYATSWTVYKKNSAGTGYEKIAEIAPSALIVTSADRLVAGNPYPIVTDQEGYPVTTGHTLPDYTDEYTALKAYANTPVEITYESAIRNQYGYEKYWNMNGKASQVATRSDGRWFYSYMNEEINANLRIDYANEYLGEENTVWTSDTYKSGTNTGNVTGATVHFTNTADDAEGGNYELTPYHDTADYDNTIYSNFNHYYKFAATEGAGYIFQGWYMERDGIQTAVTPDNVKQLTGKSQMTSNATFVARYVKNPAGHITIKHSLAAGSTGTGTTYIKVEKSANGENWTEVSKGFEQVETYSINDTNIMSYGSGYTLRVTLKTVVGTNTKFDRFSASDAEGDHSSEYFSAIVNTDAENNTSTTSFEIPVNDLFALNETTGIPAQKEGYDTFTYFSHTTKRPELTINHSKDPESNAKAAGNFFVKVEVTDSGKSHIYHTFDNGEGGYVQNDDIVIPSTYFNATDNYYLKVYLKTDMLGFSQFDKFSVLGVDLSNAQGAQGQEITISDANNKRTKTAVIIFPVSILFANGEPRVTELPYLSKLIMPDYKYEFKYTVPSYLNKKETFTYTAKDSFADQDLKDFMTLSNGDLAFQDDNKKKTFICSKAPYQDNFQKTIDFYQQFETHNRQYDAGAYTLGYAVEIPEATQQTVNVRMKFPYETQSGTHRFEYSVTDGKVNAVESNEQLITGVYGRDWITTNGVRNKDVSGTPEYIKAPLIIYDGTTQKYFKYWKVSTEGTAKNASREYTRCYDYEFNLSIYQDCIIEPEYETKSFEARGMLNPPTTYNAYDRFDPDVNREYYKNGSNGVSITFIENSRNQYNNGDAPASAQSNRTGAADRIYSDFLLTFDNEPAVKLQNLEPGKKQAGLVIQPVQILDTDENGKYILDESHYNSGATPEQIKNHLEGTTTISGLKISQFDVARTDDNIGLDNKNRIQYYYGIDNARSKTKDALADADGIIRVGDVYNNQKVLFKAFAFIGDGNGTGKLTDVVVSSQPVYFTIYEAATIAPGCYVPSSGVSGN